MFLAFRLGGLFRRLGVGFCLRLGVVLRTLLGVDEGLLARDTDVALPALRTEVGDKLAVLLGEVSAETARRRESALLCE